MMDTLSTSSNDIRPLLTQGGALAYGNGGIAVQHDHGDRVQVAQVVIPAIVVVHLLNHAVKVANSLIACALMLSATR